MSYHQHRMDLVTNPVEVGEFLGATLGYDLTPAKDYAEDLLQLEKCISIILPNVPAGNECVEEVAYLINVARTTSLGVGFTQDKSEGAGRPYCIMTHCIAILALEQALGNIEDWIEWAEEEFKVDLSVVVH